MRKAETLTILIISAGIFCFILWLVYFYQGTTSSSIPAELLPTLFTICNAAAAVALIRGFWLIRNGRKDEHIRTMLIATGFSAGFLVLYLLHYYLHGDSKFMGIGAVRPIYFTFLISHIILSAVVLPFILATLYNAYKENYNLHKKIAKITFPIWLYVSISGVIVYIIRVLFS